VQLQDAVEYAECEAVVKDCRPFREAMKKRGIEDMDLVMVDAWWVLNISALCSSTFCMSFIFFLCFADVLVIIVRLILQVGGSLSH